jgi:peptide/nickel transport system permease protein
MPAPSPSPDPGERLTELGSEGYDGGDMHLGTNYAAEVMTIADGQVAELEVLHSLDPDQVSGQAVKKRLGLGFWIASSWVGLVTALAVLAPWLPLKDPNFQDYSNLKAGPSSQYWLGTDDLGRDMLSRLIWGARVSLTVGLVAIAFGLLFGVTIGVVSGFFKGRTEGVLMGAMDVLLAFPALLLALSIITFTDGRHVAGVDLGHNVVTISLAIGIVSIAPIARLVRASTLVFSEREFVLASRTLGASRRRIITKEILPNVMLPVLSFAIIGIAIAIVAEGGLAFLGLSVSPPQATWGSMINEGRNFLATNPMISLIPCAVMFLTVLSLNLAGDRVREYFDVKEGGL